MKRGYFITGTDTGVGKTYVAAGLARMLNGQGIDVGVMKPAETGCAIRNNKLVPRDALDLIKASKTKDLLDLVNPYRFKAPVSPLVAAEYEGTSIRPRSIIKAFTMLAQAHELMLVEGAGGILVPLTNKYTYLDLAGEMRLPVIIVARPNLGTINHTLLTVSVLRSRRVAIAGIIINHAIRYSPGLAERTNPGVIERLSGVPILGVVPHGCRDAERLLSECIKKASRFGARGFTR